MHCFPDHFHLRHEHDGFADAKGGIGMEARDQQNRQAPLKYCFAAHRLRGCQTVMATTVSLQTQTEVACVVQSLLRRLLELQTASRRFDAAAGDGARNGGVA